MTDMVWECIGCGGRDRAVPDGQATDGLRCWPCWRATVDELTAYCHTRMAVGVKDGKAEMEAAMYGRANAVGSGFLWETELERSGGLACAACFWPLPDGRACALHTPVCTWFVCVDCAVDPVAGFATGALRARLPAWYVWLENAAGAMLGARSYRELAVGETAFGFAVTHVEREEALS